MIEKYFDDYQVKVKYKKRFISLFNGWLGEENLKKLDLVTKTDWQKFNILLELLDQEFNLYKVNLAKNECKKILHISSVFGVFNEDKSSDEFIQIIIPKLDIVLTEEWDYTYIIWYKEKDSLSIMQKYVQEAGLYSFED